MVRDMRRIFPVFFGIFPVLYLQSACIFAVDSDAPATITMEQAKTCIALNKDLNLASQQLIHTESEKSQLASRIHYLDDTLEERRRLIEKLDRVNTQQNNENYNQLVSQYEDLRDERRNTITQYNTKHELHISQHNSVIRLEQRFNADCLYNISIVRDIYEQACQQESVRWCTAFDFN